MVYDDNEKKNWKTNQNKKWTQMEIDLQIGNDVAWIRINHIFQMEIDNRAKTINTSEATQTNVIDRMEH